MHYLDLLLALIGIGFLIFVHELGHYWMARAVGMKVEIFSIGFGRALFSWNFQGVRWQIGWVPFGGYVKIQGMDLTQEKDPYEMPGSFYHSSPWDRIKVSFMGPMANFLLALLFFSFIWMTGGREEDFSRLTPTLGWVDPQSELYAQGVRPGDSIVSYNDEPFKNFTDHLKAPLLSPELLKATIHKEGEEKDIVHEYAVKPYPLKQHPGLKSIGVTEAARYLIIQSPNKENPFLSSSVLPEAGAKEGDRIVWVDGESIFSKTQLEHLLNDGRMLMVVQREQEHLLRRVPLVFVEDLKLTSELKAEISDWQHEAQLQKSSFGRLTVLPYNLDAQCRVEARLSFIDAEDEEKSFPTHVYSAVEEPLQEGDRILSVVGYPVEHTYQLFAHLQNKQVLMMVEREGEKEEKNFYMPKEEIAAMEAKIAALQPASVEGDLYLLAPVTPKPLRTLYLEAGQETEYSHLVEQEREHIEQMSDLDARAKKLKELEAQENQLMLGIVLMDRKVQNNPNPLVLFKNSLTEVSTTLGALVSGALSADTISGPIGIVQTIQSSARDSFKQFLFWLGFISVNLGFLNLLPIPVLDGGYIVLFLYEMVTRKRLNAKMIERMLFPFMMLLIAFLLYVSFNDILRLFT